MEFLSYFGGVFEPTAFALLVGGTIAGLILGAMPGLSPTMAVALLIPFTFHLEAAQGLILLGALYTSTVAGGAVSAILLKIPGAPANIATALDGHEMALKGQAARALHLAFLSSAASGVFGVFLLIFLAPVLAAWTLAFGASHLFWLAILGVTVIGSIDSKSFVKGLLAGCIGLWLSTIGYDDVQGVERFIFHSALSGGISIIPALIGLFAVPQILDMFSKGRRSNDFERTEAASQSIGKSFADLWHNMRALSIGTVIGSIIGLIPGVGGQIAGLVAYDQARKLSPEGEKFGTGHPEGVVAAESANSAVVGPSLVPLLTLSIPGSPTAAVLLGGLLIHGIFPGMGLFTKHPEVVWTFIDSLLIGQILMAVLGIATAAWVARVAQIPYAIMASAVIVLATFGSYSIQQSMADVYVMFALGVGMFFLQKFGFAAAPLVLGLILGPIAESNFIQGSQIADAQNGLLEYFTTGPLNLFLIILVVGSIGYSFWSNFISPSGRLRPKDPETEVSGGAPTAPWIQHTFVASVLLAVAILVAWLSFTQEPASAFLFPRLISVCFLGLSVWNFIRAVSGLAKVGEGLVAASSMYLLPGLLISAFYIFYAAKVFGFYTSSLAVFIIIYTLYDSTPLSSVRGWIMRIGIAAIFMTALYFLFGEALSVHMPKGMFF